MDKYSVTIRAIDEQDEQRFKETTTRQNIDLASALAATLDASSDLFTFSPEVQLARCIVEMEGMRGRSKPPSFEECPEISAKIRRAMTRLCNTAHDLTNLVNNAMENAMETARAVRRQEPTDGP